ncbi:hypothetical protein [Streptomyces sp. NPDC048191]|uniref:hypothetical protein n=1 Tax=Streptomyces sp. NPDC048191 TaxID=3155484 RepID=UPI0033CCABFC
MGAGRFGQRPYLTERAAPHEIAGTLGVGNSPRWAPLTTGGTWQGARAAALVKSATVAKLSTGAGRFWP